MNLSYSSQTLQDWFYDNGEIFGQKIAIAEIGRQGITYKQLSERLSEIINQLNALGIGRNDVVVVGLPDSADALITILGVACTAIVFPMNPHTPNSELERYFSQIKIKAIIVEANSKSELLTVAKNAGVAIIKLLAETKQPVGNFILSTVGYIDSGNNETPQLKDSLIYVGTAGSTSAPKIVSLTHESIYVSISHAAEWMELSDQDTALCVMPFAHLHSIVRSTLPGLLKGGKVICTRGFDPAQMLDWIDSYNPTYFTAVPSIYRALLQRKNSINWSIKSNSQLRFLVTGSDAIDELTITEVKQTFKVSLIQFYGLTEVSPLIATIPLLSQKLPQGTVGKINNIWQVKCVNELGEETAFGEEGEITVKGGIINSLAGKDSQNIQKINQGWLQTGDVGYVDEKGFLFVTGRVDDRINRAGKKISVRDVEETILSHPKVTQTVVFGVADSIYGQKVGAAIVLKSGVTLTKIELYKYLTQRISTYKIPEYIVFTDKLPLSDAGKIQRNKLSEYLGLIESSQQIQKSQSSNPMLLKIELLIIDEFRKVLKQKQITPTDSFFDLGGNSITALELLHRLEVCFGKKVSIADILDDSTPQGLAKLIEQGWVSNTSGLCPIQPEGSQKPLFAVTGIWGFPTAYRYLAELIKDTSHPLYGIGIPAVETVEEMAKICLGDIQQIQSQGPYYFIGYSFGGLLVLEIIKLLQQQGETVNMIVLLDPALFANLPSSTEFMTRVIHELKTAKQRLKLSKIIENHPFSQVIKRNLQAKDKYQRPKVNTQATLILTRKRVEENSTYVEKWLNLFNSDSEAIVLDIEHNMLDEPYVHQVAKEVKKCLLKLQNGNLKT